MNKLLLCLLLLLCCAACSPLLHSEFTNRRSFVNTVSSSTFHYTVRLNGDYRVGAYKDASAVLRKQKRRLPLPFRYRDHAIDFTGTNRLDSILFLAETFTGVRMAQQHPLKAVTLEHLGRQYPELAGYSIALKEGAMNKGRYQYIAVFLTRSDTIHRFTFLSGVHRPADYLKAEAVSQLISFTNILPANYAERITQIVSDTDQYRRYDYAGKIRQLLAIDTLLQKETYEDEALMQLVHTYVSAYYSFLDDDQQAKYYQEWAARPYPASLSTQQQDSFFNRIVLRTAIDSLFFASLAPDVQLVMLNEAHHLNSNRYIARLFLQHLKRLGFSFFAVEGLWHPDQMKQLGTAQFPAYQNGFYLQSRYYADLLTEASRLGFTLISYEDTAVSAAGRREQVQVDNIDRQTFRKYPGAKVFVYCGYDHIIKDSGAYQHMAYYLAKQSGHVPLTFRQSLLYNHYDIKNDHPWFRTLMAAYPQQEPYLIRLKDYSRCDYDIVIPGTDAFTGRGSLPLTTIASLQGDYYCIFKREEYALCGLDAIPVRVLSKAAGDQLQLRLPPGNFVLVALDTLRRNKAELTFSAAVE